MRSYYRHLLFDHHLITEWIIMLRHAYRPIIFPVDTSHPQFRFELQITNYELWIISFPSLNLQSVSLYLIMNARSLSFVPIFLIFFQGTLICFLHIQQKILLKWQSRIKMGIKRFSQIQIPVPTNCTLLHLRNPVCLKFQNYHLRTRLPNLQFV